MEYYPNLFSHNALCTLKMVDNAESYFSSDFDSQDEEDDVFRQLHQTWITDVQEKLQLRKEVGDWKLGRWTPHEIKVLKKNVKKFLKKEKVADLAQLLYSNERGIRTKFYRCIARGIQRPLFSVYRKACREFKVENFVGRWSKKKERELLRQYIKHGNNWSTIGSAMGISAQAARDKYRLISCRKRKGPWLPKEETRLNSAMQRIHGKDAEQVWLSSLGRWELVAKHVKTRNALQCRGKWLLHRAGMKEERRKWSVKDDLYLLDQLLLQGGDDEDEVDWIDLYTHWNNARSPHYIRTKWACLRRSVPGYSVKSFQENLEYCVKHVRPVLEKKLKRDLVTESDEET